MGNRKSTRTAVRFAMSNQPDNVTVENGRKNCTVVGAVNGGYIAKVLAAERNRKMTGIMRISAVD